MELVNEHDELQEKKQKDDSKRRREGRQMASDAALHCEPPGYEFMALNRASLVNHTRQKHQEPQLGQCAHCQRTFNRQGLANHRRLEYMDPSVNVLRTKEEKAVWKIDGRNCRKQ